MRFTHFNLLLKSWICLLLLGYTFLFPCNAQIKVELVSEQSEFLPYEALLIGVRIINHSGQTLKLGNETDWVSFIVEKRDGKLPVSRLAEMNVKGEFELETAKMGTKWFNIAPFFGVQQLGWYKISAVVKIPEMNETLSTTPHFFEVVRGRKIWEQKFGVRLSQADGTTWIQGRKYSLIEASSLKHYRLYLRLTDADDNKVFTVYSLGPTVSFAQPEAQLDKNNQLHVLTQAGASFFRYFIIDPTGDLVGRHSFEYSNSRPVLRKDQDGKIKVLGGSRKISDDDLPKIYPGEIKGEAVKKTTDSK